jgi:hypothetical protein
MIASLHQIKKLALEMRDQTSHNDSRRERMQDIMNMADELMAQQHTDARR